jgi:hypothetical protein
VAKRTISDTEIRLIKSMLNRGMKNKDIQFFFNRPDRSVNTGRISTIANGTYSNSSSIAPSPDHELDMFIEQFSKARGIGHTGFLSNIELSWTDKASRLFRKEKDGNWVLHGGETEEHECKLEFNPKKLIPVVRAIAALANNKGGYIFFGITNGRCQVEGVDSTFGETDIAQIVEKTKAHLAPTPTLAAKDTFSLDGKIVGFIRVEKFNNPPIIVYRDGDGLHESDILYRYPGQSARIKFSDLKAMLDQRDHKAQLTLAKAAEKLANVGTANALVLDLEQNTLETDGRSIILDEKLVDNIKFIKEGQFEEKIGSPTLKLVGNVKAVAINSPVVKKITREAIFQEDILEAFINFEKVEQPIQYIIAGLAQPRKWLPNLLLLP